MDEIETTQGTSAKRQAPGAKEESASELLIRAAELLEKRRGKRAKSFKALAVQARAIAARLGEL